MGVIINGVKQGMPYINGVKHNAFVNGQKVFSDVPVGGPEFITTWQTTTANESITIPTVGGGYDFTIDWGDGSTGSYNGTAPNPSHIYATPGVHTVQITGQFPRIYFNNVTMRNKILTVEQWGDIEWKSMGSAFYGASNLAVVATDAPKFNTVSSVSFYQMFRGSTNLTGNFNHWDTSKVNDMSYMFSQATNFNQPIGDWNTSNIMDMSFMFYQATNFNQDVGDWDTSKVMSMLALFGRASSFNQDLSGWCVLNIASKPGNFDIGTSAWVKEGRQPIRGTCPDQP